MINLITVHSASNVVIDIEIAKEQNHHIRQRLTQKIGIFCVPSILFEEDLLSLQTTYFQICIRVNVRIWKLLCVLKLGKNNPTKVQIILQRLGVKKKEKKAQNDC